MDETVFKPRFSPRSIGDAFVSFLVGLLQVVLLFLLPTIVAFYLSDSFVMAALVINATYLLFLLFSVTKVSVSPAGIRFFRYLGSPKILEWSEIEDIERVSRGEIVLRGWLWPLFPAREMTPSLTSTGHIRIRYGRKFVYFPPKDIAAFERSVGEHLRS